jgi:hypothetical protein
VNRRDLCYKFIETKGGKALPLGYYPLIDTSHAKGRKKVKILRDIKR